LGQRLTSLRPRRLMLAGALLGPWVSLLVAASAAFPASLPPDNLVANPSFESTTSGWEAFHSTVGRVAAGDAPHGEFVGKAAWAGTSNEYALVGYPPSVIESAQQGFDYTGRAWVKGNAASAGRTAQLFVREWTPSGQFVGSNLASVTLSASTYQEVSVSRTASATGNTIDTYLARPAGSVVGGDAFFADAISLRLDDSSSCPEALGGFDVDSWPPACWRPYADTSPFNRLIPANPPLHPNSSAIVDDLTTAAGAPDDIVVGDVAQDFGNPTYYSRSTDPHFTFKCTADFGGPPPSGSPCELMPNWQGLSVRIPDQGEPAGGAPNVPLWSTGGPSAPFGNKVSNSSFEQNNQGWEAGGGAVFSRYLETPGGAPDGSRVARVRQSSSTSPYWFDDNPDSAHLDARSGHNYAARAWVRGNANSAGKTLELWVREWTPTGQFVDSERATVTLSSNQYQMVEVRYSVQEGGNTIDTYLARPSGVVLNEAIFIDAYHMVKRPDQDAHLTAVDQASGWEYDLWHVSSKPQGGGTLEFGWGGRTRVGIDGDGLESDGTAARYGNLAGIIRAQELQAGVINHALVMVVPCVDGTVYPSTAVPGSGGTTFCADPDLIDDPPALGSHFQLDVTDSEIEAMGLPSWKKAIVRAMAHYGAYVSDTTPVPDEWGFEIESGATYRSFGTEDPFVTLAASLGLPRSDTNTNAPCPVPQMTGWEVNTPSECAAYGQINDPNNTQRDEYRYVLADPAIDWSRLRVVDACAAQGNC
jgi:hypothetical protein